MPRTEKGEEVIVEISVDELLKSIDMDDATIREELTAVIIDKFGLPPSEELLGRVEEQIREHVRSELEKRGLPTEEWLIQLLYKLHVHMEYVLMAKVSNI
jgi:hypothetical protein